MSQTLASFADLQQMTDYQTFLHGFAERVRSVQGPTHAAFSSDVKATNSCSTGSSRKGPLASVTAVLRAYVPEDPFSAFLLTPLTGRSGV